MRIANNIMAMNTHRFYTNNNNAVSKSAEKLSSGYRINRAGDDAAGLAISEKMRAQVRGLNMAKKNSQDAVSLVQTAEGALQEVHSMLQRMNELAVQSASGTNDSGVDRAALQQEFSNLQDEIDQIASTTTFNDMGILDGSLGGGKIGFVAGAAETTGAGTLAVAHVQKLTLTALTGTQTFTIGGVTITAGTTTGVNDGDDAKTQAAAIVTELNKDGTFAADWTAADNGDGTITFTAKKPGLIGTSGPATALATSGTDAASAVMSQVTAGAEAVPGAGNGDEKAGVVTVDYNGVNVNTGDKLTVEGTTYMINTGDTALTAEQLNGATEVKVALTGQETDAEKATKVADAMAAAIGATSADGNTVAAANGKLTITEAAGQEGTMDSADYQAVGGIKIQVGAEEGQTLEFAITAMNTAGLGLTKDAVNIATQDAASSAITATRNAINANSTQRAELGAMQNRLEYKISNLANTAENLSSAESRIRDVDIASEMTSFTKNNILSQAATAMLAQANSLPQNVLSLLR